MAYNNYARETILPDEEILMAIKTEPEVIIEHEEDPDNMETTNCQHCLNQTKIFEAKFKEINDTIKNLQETISSQNEVIMKALAEQKVLSERVLHHEVLNTNVGVAFPVETIEDLSDLNSKICESNHKLYVDMMSNLLNGRLTKTLTNVMSLSICMDVNVDGVHGKKRLKDFQSFFKALSDITSSDRKIDQLRVVMEQRLNQIQAQINVILEAQEEQNLLLRNFIASQQDMNSKFPLKTAKNLKELDGEITPENRETYKNTIKTLLKPQGIRKNLKYLLSTEIINEYNIDGVHGKKCLKDLRNFYEVVIDSIEITSKSGTAEQQLRDAIRLAKKRYLKNKSISRRNASNSEMEYE